jgi:cyanophycin synthetase
MQFRRTWVLRGPNRWAPFPVLEAELDLGGVPPPSHDQTSAAASRLAVWLPGATASLAANPDVPLLFLHVAHALQAAAGGPSGFGQAHAAPEGLYRVVLDYDEEAVGRACLDAALDLLGAALAGEPRDVAAVLTRLRDLGHETRLGPSTGSIVRAALAHGIPARRLNDGSLVQLGHGARGRRVWTAETDRTSVLAEAVAQDKQLTRDLLRSAGVPVPEGRPVDDAEDAWSAAEDLGGPVVVKPQYGNQGRGVATDLTTREQVLAAYAAAKEEGSAVVVERFVPGVDFRVLVVGDAVVAASLREPAHVVGDGRSTVAELVAVANLDPRRSDGHATALSYIKLDPIGLGVLAEQGYTPESVPPEGARVLIRRNGNLSTGGTATDVTDRVHPEVAARAVEAARVVGLDVAGVDVVARDIGRPLEEQAGAVVEVNAGPGLRMHLEPSAGTPRPVGDAVVRLLFPDGQMGRVPLVAVTGVNGKTTTTRLIAHLLRRAGRYVGMTCTDGTYLDGRRTETRDCSGPQSARAVLLHPRVEAAVLETARGGILREGLGFDRCDVAVVTNLGSGDHFGLRGIETLDELARVKRVVVEAVAPGGAAVLNAADPPVAAMAARCPGAVVYFSRDPENDVLASHRAAGGRAAFVRGGSVVLAEGGREEVLTALADVPLTQPGPAAFQVENVLAAAAAAWRLGLPHDVLREGLASFGCGPGDVPGRFNVFRVGGSAVVADYAHNPSAVASLVAALDGFPQARRTAVFAGCNRRAADLVEMGETLGHGFDRVVLYEDRGNNGVADGELNSHLRRGLAAGRRVQEVVEFADEPTAIRAAVGSLGPSELVVVGVESIEDALACIRSCLGKQGQPAAAG